MPLSTLIRTGLRRGRPSSALRSFSALAETTTSEVSTSPSATTASNDNATAGAVTEILTNQDWINLKQQAAASNRGILLQFTAAWCPPCRVISPVVASLAEKTASTLNVVKADIDNIEIGDVVSEHAVSAVPMFVGYGKDGTKRVSFTGADKAALERAVDELSK